MNEIRLTARERELSACLLKGFSAKQVAKELGISLHTVQGYQKIIRKKIGAKNSYHAGCVLEKILGSALSSQTT